MMNSMYNADERNEIVNIYFDVKNQEVAKLQDNLNFVYKHQYREDCLPISIIPFGDQKLYKYGFSMYETPLFTRIDQ